MRKFYQPAHGAELFQNRRNDTPFPRPIAKLDSTTMISERIKILFVIDYFHRTGGTETHLAQLISGLSTDRFDCSLVTFDSGANPLLDDLRARGVPIINLPVGREYVPNAVIQGWRLWRLIRRNKYDIVQTFHQKSDTYGALIARLAGARCLISSKRDTGQLRKPWHTLLNRCMRKLFSRFIVVADAVRRAAILTCSPCSMRKTRSRV